VNGVHDLGGMENMGPVAPEAEEPVFHTDWERRVHALVVASPTRRNIDEGRHQRELIPGPALLAMTYYEKWFTGLSDLLVKYGYASREEIDAGKAAPGFAKETPGLAPDEVSSRLGRRGSYLRDGPAPAFAVGDQVRARNINPSGHTRLPRYARGHVGVIIAFHGAHVFPDTHAHGGGDDPRPLYTVRFSARELWGDAAHTRDCVSLDLWEPYLERA